MSAEEKQLARQKREIRTKRWITALSWTLPVVSFSSFFAIWHDIAGKPVKATTGSTHQISSSVTTEPTDTVLYQYGMTSPQISKIQNELQMLGYFQHTVTEYFGPVTQQAVEAFQQSQGLPVTGKVDQVTLNRLAQAVSQTQTNQLLGNNTTSTQNVAPPTNQSTSGGSGSVVSPSFPSTITSAS